MLHVIRAILVFDNAEDVELYRQINIKRLNVSICRGHDASDLGVIHGIFGFNYALITACLDLYDYQQVGTTCDNI